MGKGIEKNDGICSKRVSGFMYTTGRVCGDYRFEKLCSS